MDGTRGPDFAHGLDFADPWSSHSSPVASRVKIHNYGGKKLQFSDRQLQISDRKDYGCSEVQNGRLLAPKQPEICQSCAPWQNLLGCTKTRKLRKSCTPQHGNFLVGLFIYSKYLPKILNCCSNMYSRLMCYLMLCHSFDRHWTDIKMIPATLSKISTTKKLSLLS